MLIGQREAFSLLCFYAILDTDQARFVANNFLDILVLSLVIGLYNSL